MKTYLTYSFILVLTIALSSCKKGFPDDPLTIKDLGGCAFVPLVGKHGY
jgi:hypothetical protein